MAGRTYIEPNEAWSDWWRDYPAPVKTGEVEIGQLIAFAQTARDAFEAGQAHAKAERDAAVARAEAAERREAELRKSLVAAMKDHAALFAAQDEWMQKAEAAKDRLQAAEAKAQRMREALSRIADHKPSFDYVRSGCHGAAMDQPGSPYDRGKEEAAKHLSGIARAALRTEREG